MNVFEYSMHNVTLMIMMDRVETQNGNKVSFKATLATKTLLSMRKYHKMNRHDRWMNSHLQCAI